MKFAILRLSVAVLIAFLITSCGGPDADNRNKIERMKWLLGKWEMPTPDGIRCELWQKASDTLYSGVSYLLTGTDSIILEYIDIQLSGNELYYIPVVMDQNEGQPVSFKLTKMGKETFVFENKEHDFPQEIGYRNFAKDSLLAWIEGPSGRKTSRKEFIMTRAY